MVSNNFYEKMSAVVLLTLGIVLTIAGFIVPPLGEISDSVLWVLAQTLLYAGSIFGVKIYIDHLVFHHRQLMAITGSEPKRGEEQRP